MESDRDDSGIEGSSKDASHDSGRVQATVVKPIIYGSVAHYLGHENEDGHTHQWTVYLKSAENEDMSKYVQLVQFRLHNTYPDRIRNIIIPPYSLTETGYGEFKIAMRVYFFDPNENYVTLYHDIKLFKDDYDSVSDLSDVPVTSEYYDEMIFQNPTVPMFELLTHPKKIGAFGHAHMIDYEAKKAKDLEIILAARKKVKDEITLLKARLDALDEDIKKYKNQTNK